MPVNPQPKPNRIKLSPYKYSKMKTEAWLIAGGICERCYSYLPRNEAHFHHKTKRSQGGSDEVSNGEILCWKCHRLIEDGLI